MTEWVARAPPSHPDLEGMQATEINTRVLVTCINLSFRCIKRDLKWGLFQLNLQFKEGFVISFFVRAKGRDI